MDMRCGVSDAKSDKSLVDGAPCAYRIAVSIIVVIGLLLTLDVTLINLLLYIYYNLKSPLVLK